MKIPIVKDKEYLAWLFMSIALGVMSSKVSSVATLWGIVSFGLAFYFTLVTQNKNGIAHITAGYFMATEVFFRMSWSGLPWEFSKYAIIALLSLGMVVDNVKRYGTILFVLYFLLMMPAVYLTIGNYDDFSIIKKKVFFSMLGPLVLTLSGMYFYRYKMTMESFITLSRWIVLGTLSMGIIVYTNVGDYTALKFNTSSNAAASGGFSGNQVSVAFGLGIMVIFVNLILKNKLFYYIWIDIVLISIFTYQALMTFSRGGLLGGILSVVIGAFVYYFSNIEQAIEFLRKNFIKLILAIALMTYLFNVVNDITGGLLYERYFNVDPDGYTVKEDVSTGRGDILIGDLMLFEQTDYLGIGIGESGKNRPLMTGFAPHVEYTRMLAEHGVLGVLALLIMFLLPLKHFIELIGRPKNQLIFTSCMLISLITMTHAAMRTGMVGFFYGLAFIIIVNEAKNKP